MYPELIRQKIKEEGYAVEALLGDEVSPVAAYTLGLSETSMRAEIILLHHDEDEALAILHQVARMVRQGLVLVPAAVLVNIGSKPLRVLPVHAEEGLRLCSLYRWLFRKSAAESTFFQLQLGQRVKNANGTESYIFPVSEDQDVRQYVERTCL